MNSKWFAPVVIIGMLIFSAAVYNALPAQIPIHWDVAGNVNGMGDKLFGVLVLPIICIIVSVVMPGVRRLDPLRQSYTTFEDTFRFIINLVIMFMAFTHVLTLGLALGWDIDISKVVGVGTGLLFVLLGNVMARIRPNWFMGIRTPWTLSDPEVWRITHRVGGRIMFVAGLAVIVISLILPAELAVSVMLVGLLGASAYILAYSYFAWRRIHSAA
jgi:uncharacterized membrane protein